MLITVVIPTFQASDSLAACLECIERQNLPREKFEVIVTDDGDGPAVRDLVREKLPWARWTQGPRRGPAANRNHGALLATGEWIAFLDDDCLPAAGWLKAIGAQADVDVIEGKTVCPDARDTPFLEWAENLRGGMYWSCNLAVKRAAFERLGGFDEDFLEEEAEDMEFAWRIAMHNLHTRFVAAALVERPARAITWGEIWRRTWLERWMALYRLKTGQGTPMRASWFTALVAAMKRETANLLRTSLRFFAEFDPRSWRAKLFNQFWKWLTFPLALPWALVWEIRFRNALRRGPAKKNP